MNRRLEMLSTIRVSCLCMLAAVGLGRTCSDQEWRALPPAERPPEKLRGVLSRQRLTPSLRSVNVTLRYSPDGRYLLFQDPSGIHVLSREPLEALGYIDAPHSYAARFSRDSQSIIVVSLALSYQRWAVRDGQRLDSKALPIRDGCVDAQLSPDGELLACYRPDFSLAVLELSTGQWIFSEVIHASDPHLTVIPIPLDLDIPFAGPFGFTLSHDMRPLANRATYRLPMTFSLDGRTLIAGDVRDAVRVDLVARRKISLPSAIKNQMSGTVAIQSDTRVLLIPPGKPGEPVIRSLKNGDVLAIPNFTADSAYLATNARYALLFDSGVQGARVFDLEDDRQVEIPKNIAADVRDGELAVATENGEFSLCRLGEHVPTVTVSLPFSGMPVLRSASVSPTLDTLAIAVDGEGVLFQTEDGRRISTFPRFSAVDFVDSATALFLMQGPRSGPSQALDYLIDRVDTHGAIHAGPENKEATLATGPQTIVRLDKATAKTLPMWAGGRDLLLAGGSVLFEYSFESSARGGFFLPQVGDAPVSSLPQAGGVPSAGGVPLPQGVGVPFRLRALDLGTGKELWSRSFTGLPPIPFADPQGERLVLSWRAKSAGARSAAKHEAVAKEELKRATLTDHDSFLEALDARTGKSVGGVLVQSGTDPTNFDFIFSTGEAIIFSRDGVRVSVYSMLDGQLKGRLVGLRPTANARSNLLALDNGSGRLGIYDLNTVAQLDELVFSDQIVYTHFSEDGQRLFILTENQWAFVLDMKGVREVH